MTSIRKGKRKGELHLLIGKIKEDEEKIILGAHYIQGVTFECSFFIFLV